MPRNGSGDFDGNFGTYAGGGGGQMSDEDAVAQALDTAFSYCGNAGQETMIGDIADDFDDWANDVLEGIDMESRGTEWQDFISLLLEWYGGRADKVQGTIDIWRAAWEMIAEQSGYHDSVDERASYEVGVEFN